MEKITKEKATIVIRCIDLLSKKCASDDSGDYDWFDFMLSEHGLSRDELRHNGCGFIVSKIVNKYPNYESRVFGLESVACDLSVVAEVMGLDLKEDAPIDDKPLTDAIIMDWLNGTPMAHTIDLRCTELQEVLLKFSLDEIKAMDRLDQSGERHDQQIDSGDDYGDLIKVPVEIIDMKPEIKELIAESFTNVGEKVVMTEDDQPYIPNVGDECEVIFHDDDRPEYFRATFIAVIDGRLIYKSGDIIESDSTKFEFRPLKTERDLCMDVIADGLNKSIFESQAGYYGFAVDKLIKAGKIK